MKHEMKYRYTWILGMLFFVVASALGVSECAEAAGTMSRAQWKKAPTGSAGVLEGKSVIVSIFVDDKSSKWSDSAKKKVNRKLGVAEKYIEKQAKNYGKKADLVTDIYRNPSLCYSYQTKQRVTSSEKKLDKLYKDVCKYIEKSIPIDDIRKKYKTDSVGFVIHVNKSGISSTIVHYMEEKENFYECSTMFSKYEKTSEGAATYAHEILHLFGARDLYVESLADGITSSFIKYVEKKIPNEIMFSTCTMSGKLLKYQITNDISRVTAYYLGWKNKIPETKKYALMRGTKKGCFSDGTSLE